MYHRYAGAIFLIACLFAATGNISAQQATELGESIVHYAHGKEGKKVKRGECWDLVAEALDHAGADWERPDKFGSVVKWEKQDLLPGDIIEFRNVKIKRPDRYSLEMPQHFAIVAKQLGKYQYRILHQNYNGERRVSLFDIDLNYMTRGKVSVYRPSG